MRETFVQLDRMMPIILEQLKSGNAVTFTPRGSSMRPTVRGGIDQVILENLPAQLNKYAMPLYRRDDGHYVLHRIVAVDRERDEYTLMGDNQFYAETIRQEQMLAVVSAVIRKGKTVPVTSRRFRAYSVFWHYSRPVRHLFRRAGNWFKRLRQGEAV